MTHQSFDTRTITETVRGALSARAVTSYRLITEAGLLTIYSAAHLRYSEDAGRPEVYLAGVWVPVPDLGIAEMARVEGLRWDQEGV